MSGFCSCPLVHLGWFDKRQVAKRYIHDQSKSLGTVAKTVIMVVVHRYHPLAVQYQIKASWLVAVLFRAVVDAPVEGCVTLLAMGLDYRDPGGCSFK